MPRELSPYSKRPLKLPTFERELRAWSDGDLLVVGVDEVGRGCLAGPVVAGACVLFRPDPGFIEGKKDPFEKSPLQSIPIVDSKALKPSFREESCLALEKYAYASSVAFVPSHVIDEVNILNASLLAMKEALIKITVQLGRSPDLVLVDGNQKIKEWEGKQETLISGDSRSLSIAAASILAKVHRDRHMEELSLKYPSYEFHSNKGYGSPTHLEALRNEGPVSEHRFSFSPVKAAYLEKKNLV